MLDLFNIALRTLMCLAFLLWVVRPMLFALTRKEPNVSEIEEVAQIAITSAFQAQKLPDVPLTYVAPPEPAWFTQAKEKMPVEDTAPAEPAAEALTDPTLEEQSSPSASELVAPEAEEIDPAEAMRQMREKMKAEQKKAKPTIPPELLQDANSYEDKLVLVRMLVDQEHSRVAGVLKRMIQP